MKQLELELTFRIPPCNHQGAMIVTRAYVPAGLACMKCGLLFYQYIPQSPDQIGYVTADWAWKHKHGFEWTTQTREEAQ